ncbi:hypothetical protein J3459_017649 [Metarhizium acridum]|nr:hypothetical protein J3459_017649 [Metarhizium acridum]
MYSVTGGEICHSIEWSQRHCGLTDMSGFCPSLLFLRGLYHTRAGPVAEKKKNSPFLDGQLFDGTFAIGAPARIHTGNGALGKCRPVSEGFGRFEKVVRNGVIDGVGVFGETLETNARGWFLGLH